ncbi:MAG TPA: efflux RND transporter periplasmic adaptor subunit [Bacteroidales bacterium]|nr:efflux RND transporter periplasmic adaptor subunit [Bacteroidales bacterium]
MKRLIFIFLLVIISACNNSGNNDRQVSGNKESRGVQHRHRNRRGQGQADPANLRIRRDTIFVPSGSPVNTKIVLHTVSLNEQVVQFTTIGTVRPITGHKAEIAVPFEGRIVRSFTKLGQKVNPGTPLFEISSSDYLESVRILLQAERERDLAEKNYLRKKELMESGISSKKEFDEAKLGFDLAVKEYQKAVEILKIYNLEPDDADLARPLIIRSPIKGEVVKADVTVGQYIKSDSEAPVIVADLNKIWVIASVKEKDLGAVSLQDMAEILTESMPGISVSGKVVYIGNIMNEETRSVEVYIECDNPGQVLKCGMFVSARLSHKLDKSIIIPASSVLQDYDKTYLFLQTGPGIFIKKEVTVMSMPDKNLMVRSGIEPGNIIVAEGAIYLQ